MTRAAWQPRCAARRILPQIARRYREYSEDWAGLSLKRQKMTSLHQSQALQARCTEPAMGDGHDVRLVRDGRMVLLL